MDQHTSNLARVVTFILVLNISLGFNANCQQQVLPEIGLVFSSVNPDANSSSKGGFGISNSNNSNAIFTNFSQSIFSEDRGGVSLSYKPNFINGGGHFFNFSGLFKIDDKQAVGVSERLIRHGRIEFTDINGNSTGNGRPREYEVSIAYSRLLTRNLSVSIRPKYVVSNLATGQQFLGDDIITGRSLAADLSATYSVGFNSYREKVTFGATLANLGGRISYFRRGEAMNLPRHLSAGLSYSKDIIDGFTTQLSVGYQHQLGDIAILGNRWSAGNEFIIKDIFSLRIAYESQEVISVTESIIHIGAGLNINLFSIDVGYINYLDPINTNFDDDVRISLSFNFK